MMKEEVAQNDPEPATSDEANYQKQYDQHVQAYYEHLSLFCSHNLIHEMKNEPTCEQERNLLGLVFQYGNAALGISAEHPDDVIPNQEFSVLFQQFKLENCSAQIASSSQGKENQRDTVNKLKAPRL